MQFTFLKKKKKRTTQRGLHSFYLSHPYDSKNTNNNNYKLIGVQKSNVIPPTSHSQRLEIM
jgi:hypothetical protein